MKHNTEIILECIYATWRLGCVGWFIVVLLLALILWRVW